MVTLMTHADLSTCKIQLQTFYKIPAWLMMRTIPKRDLWDHAAVSARLKLQIFRGVDPERERGLPRSH